MALLEQTCPVHGHRLISLPRLDNEPNIWGLSAKCPLKNCSFGIPKAKEPTNGNGSSTGENEVIQ